MSPRDRKAELARRLEENHQRHSSARQELGFDAGRRHLMLPVDAIDPNPFQPRKVFDEDELRQLAGSIAELGQHQPVVVRPAGERWQLVAGERRWRACRLLGKPTIEALVQDADDARMAVTALAENMEREDLSDYEIGIAIRRIEDQFPSKAKLAEALGRTREDLYKYLAFEALPEDLRARLDAQPRLLSRAAAADVKRMLADERALPLLREAWTKLEAGELQQTRLAAFVAAGLGKAEPAPQRKAVERALHRFTREGQHVGTVSRDAAHFVIRLKVDALSGAQEQRLRSFVEALLAESGPDSSESGT